MHNLRRYPTLFVIVTAIIVLLAGCGSDKAAPTGTADGGSNKSVVLHLAYFPNITHAPAIIGMANGAFQKAVGVDVKIEPRIFLEGPSEMEALFAREVDIGYVGISPAINAYVKSQGKALHVISGAASGGAVLVARKGSGIKTADDIIGKRIGTPKRGSTQDVAARYFIVKTKGQKLSDEGGATQIIPTEPPQLPALFERGDLDAAWNQEPWGTRLVKETGATLILDERDLWPDKKYATTVVVVRTEFLDQHPGIVEKFLGAHIALVGQIQANKTEAAKTIGTEIKRLTTRTLAADIIAESLKRLDFTYDAYPKTIEAQADHAFSLGFLGKTRPDISTLLDAAPLNRALSAAGKPRLIGR